MHDKEIGICIECESEYLKSTSAMNELCPECAHLLYGYKNCDHIFKDGRCIRCLWNGQGSNYTKGRSKMKIEHIAMYVNDLESARDFFVKYFGAKANNCYHNLKTDFRSYFLSFDEGTRLEIMNKPQMIDDAKDINRTGYIHIAFSLGSAEKVDQLTAKLKSDGYEVISEPRTTGDGYYESCIIGLEGNQIELTV